MTRPEPKPVPEGQVRSAALTVIRTARFPMLATVGGDQPRVRPVAPVRVDGFTVYVANLRPYQKTHEIETNPRVELCYIDEHHDHVRITGWAEVLTDRGLLQEIWEANPLMRNYLASIDDPQLIVYRIQPERVRFMKEWALEYQEVPLTA